MTRILLRDIPKAGLGYDGFELTVAGGFRGLRGVAPGFHRIELPGPPVIALSVIVSRDDTVKAFVLRDGRFEPAPRSPLDAAAAAGDLDRALFDAAALPEAPTRAWRALTSQLATLDDVSAWRTARPPSADGWAALDTAGAARQLVALQGAWLALNHDRDEAAADHLVALLDACARADGDAVARHPAVFAGVLDAVAAMQVVAAELATTLIDRLGPLIALCATSGASVVRAAAARLTAAR